MKSGDQKHGSASRLTTWRKKGVRLTTAKEARGRERTLPATLRKEKITESVFVVAGVELISKQEGLY